MESLHEVLTDQLKDLYSAESQLLKALPKMAKAASTEQLQEAITAHLEETEGHVERLEKVGKSLGVKLTGKKCKAMEGLIEEGKEALDSGAEGSLLDAAIIAAAQKVEHYEISGYGTARAMAEQLGETDVSGFLQETLDEESAANEKLTAIAEEEVYPNIHSEGEAEDEDEEPAGSRGSRGRANTNRR